MKERILLIGASGLVGRALDSALREAYQIIPTAGPSPWCTAAMTAGMV